MIMQIIGIVMKLLGFLVEQKGASDQIKKDIIGLSEKMAGEGLLPVKVNDKMKDKWAKIDAQIAADQAKQQGENTNV